MAEKDKLNSEKILFQLKNMLFEDLPDLHAADVQPIIMYLKTTNDATPAPRLIRALFALYCHDYRTLTKLAESLTPTAFSDADQPFVELVQWLGKFHTHAHPTSLLAELDQWMLSISHEMQVLASSHVLILLANNKQFLAVFETRLQLLANLIEQPFHAIHVQAAFFLSYFSFTIFDNIVASVHFNTLAFTAATELQFPNLQLCILQTVAKTYAANNLKNEAAKYFALCEKQLRTQQLSPFLCLTTYFNLYLFALKNQDLQTAKSYENNMQTIPGLMQFPDIATLYVDCTKLITAIYQKESDFQAIWDQYLAITERYIELKQHFIFQPLELLLLEIEASIHEQYTHDADQLLCTYFALLNLLNETQPNKLLAIAKTLKNLAQTYARLENYPTTWKYYQLYDKYLQRWQKQNSIKKLHPAYEAFTKQFQALQLEHLKSATHSLKNLSTIDHLTQVYSRHYLDTLLKQQQPTGYALLDVDFFKKFNDTYGHQSGDSALQTIAKFLKNLLGKDDVVIRYGGEEFLVVSFHPEFQHFQQLVETMRSGIARVPIPLAEQKNEFLTVSIGALWQGNQALPFSDAFSQADKALYHVKKNGRNNYYLETIIEEGQHSC